MKIPVYKTEGIIIRRFNSNEFDKLLVVYTRKFGKILVKAKSLRKKEAKMKGILELFNYVHLTLAHGKNIDTVAGAMAISDFHNMKAHLPSIAAAYYISELFDKLLVGPEKDEKIWQLLLKAFLFLDQKKRSSNKIKELLSRLEWVLLSLLGHQPEQKRVSYLDAVQNICGQKIESQTFLSRILA